MKWFKIEISTLRSIEYMGSNPTKRASWLNVLAYCVEMENGGRIVGAVDWEDRQWQQLCGVTRREVVSANKLLIVDGKDIVVWKYPVGSEAKHNAISDARRNAANARWNANAMQTGKQNAMQNMNRIEAHYREPRTHEHTHAHEGTPETPEQTEPQTTGSAVHPSPPTVETVITAGQQMMIAESFCREWHETMTNQSWMDNSCRPCAFRWRNLLKKYWETERATPKAGNGSRKPQQHLDATPEQLAAVKKTGW